MGEKALTLLIFLTVLFQGSDFKKLEGVLETDSRWEFLTRFCFLSKLGGMEYNIEYPKGYGVQRLLFYYDTPGQWSYVYKRDKSCEEKTAVATDVLNYFSLDGARCGTVNRGGVEWYKCQARLDFHSSRERWWYLVVERCADPTDTSKKGLYMEYKLHLTNGDDLLHKEFSADQFYILPINIVFFILYVIMLALSIIVAVLLKKKQLYHTTYAMFLTAVTIWTLSLLCLVIAWGSYGNTGWEMKRMEVFGRILQAASTIIFMLMLILMSKGYTIVRGRLTTKASVKITVFIAIYIVMSITLFIWEARIFDEGKVLFYYENPAGYCMIAIQLLGWLWMTKAAVFTLKHYSNTTSKFYIPFYILFTLWFWVSPIIIMFAIMVMPKWMREKTVHGVLQFISFAGHLVFLFLTRPSKANSNFPYNVKTSQIGIIDDDNDEDAGDDAGSTNMYTVNHNNNDNNFLQGTGPNLDMFIVAKGGSSSSRNNGGDDDDGGGGGVFYNQQYPHHHLHYPPLDPYMARNFGGSGDGVGVGASSSTTSDSPPPSYPQVMELNHYNAQNNDSSRGPHHQHHHHHQQDAPSLPPLPPLSTPRNDNDNNNNNNASSSNRLPPLARANQLPPIGADDGSSRETTMLPPIRGSGLPALETEPSAPPLSPPPPPFTSSREDRVGSPPDYTKMFQAT